jgi:hypothetical protein
LYFYAFQLYNSVSGLPPGDPARQDAEATASRVVELASWIFRIDPLWCAWVSTTGHVDLLNPAREQCQENDDVVPVWSQQYPGAFNLRVSGAPHTRETKESENTLYEVLTHYFQVPPRGSSSPRPTPTTPANSLHPGDRLGPGESRDSSNGRFHFVYQGDGNLVLYAQDWSRLWASNTVGTAGAAQMQGDGNLVVYDGTFVTRWNSNTVGAAGAFLVVQDDGNVVIYPAGGGAAIWWTGTVQQ